MDEIKNEAIEGGKTEEVKEELFTKAQVDELMAKEKEGWEEKLREAEKLAQMNSQQKDSYRRKQAEEALAAREAAVSKRELAADAAEKLKEYKLPAGLAACVNLTSAEECDKSIECLKAAFSEAVGQAVSERIRGNAPKLPASGGKDAFLDGLCM